MKTLKENVWPNYFPNNLFCWSNVRRKSYYYWMKSILEHTMLSSFTADGHGGNWPSCIRIGGVALEELLWLLGGNYL